MPCCLKLSTNFDRKAISNILEVFNIILFRNAKRFRKVFALDKLSELVCKTKSICNLNGISHLNVRRAQNLDGISHLVVLGTFKVCLELSSNSRAQFGLVMNKFSELEHTSK